MTITILGRRLSIKEFDVLHILGAGGFGTCRKALYHNQVVCVKQINQTTKKEAAIQSFKAETKDEFFQFRHLNIVRLLAASTMVSQADDISELLMVFEYIPGSNLQHVIDDDDVTIDLKQMCSYGCNIADALMYVHAFGIAHLDLKPANVMVTLDGVCKLADFGCSQYIKAAVTPRSILTATCAYRAPELYKGCAPTAKCDVYAFGICLWQFWSREFPFAGIDQHSLIFRVVKFDLRPTFDETTYINEQYKDLITQCWSAKPTERPELNEVLKTMKSLFI